jgi:hypothetical protein
MNLEKHKPAYPFFEEVEKITKHHYEGVDENQEEYEKTETEHVQHRGLSIRQKFIMSAMQGLLASKREYDTSILLAIDAVKIGDAVLTEESRTRRNG